MHQDFHQTEVRDKKVILIGIDSATWSLIRPWAEEGKLPNFKKLMDSGIWGILRSTIPPVTIPACLSLFSGRSPNNLEIYDFVEFDRKLHRLKLFRNRKTNDMIWDILSKYDKKAVVINVPSTYPPAPFDGYMITGMPTPSANYTYPKGLKAEIKEVLGSIGLDYIIEPSSYYEVGKEKQFLKELLDDLKMKYEVAKYMLETKEWHLFVVFFRSTDIVQHFFLRNGLRDKVLEIYKRLDEYLNYFISKVDDDTYLVLVSDHGSEEPRRVLQINSILRKTGYLVLRNSKTKMVLYRVSHLIVKGFLSLTSRSPWTLSLIRRLLSKWGTMIPVDPYINLQNALILDIIDWRSTKAVGAGYAKTGKIYITGENRRETSDNIAACLDDLMKNHDISIEVRKGSDVFTDTARAPDLILISKERGLSVDEDFHSDAILTERFSNDALATDHNFEGIFLFCGPNLKKGRTTDEAEIVDLVPTLLWVMNIPLPEDLSGKILFDLFGSDYVAKHPPRYQALTPREGIKEYEWKKNEEEEIKQRLKQLGYI